MRHTVVAGTSSTSVVAPINGGVASKGAVLMFSVVKAYCLMKQGRHADCSDILTELRPLTTIIDPFAVKYLVFILTAFG